MNKFWKNARYFVWIIFPATAYLAFLTVGLPHHIWSYSFRQIGPASNSNPFAGRWYTRCTYWGPFGGFNIFPSNGKCSWIIFRKDQG